MHSPSRCFPFFSSRSLSVLLLGLACAGVAADAAEEKDDLMPKNWDFYGSARLGSSYWHRNKWYRDVEILDTLTGNVIGKRLVVDTVPVKRLFMDLQYNSFFGARGKTERIGFRFEVGWMPSVQDIDIVIQGTQVMSSQRRRDAVRLRRLYGEWFINDQFTLLVGQDWTISNLGSSNQIFFMDQGLSYTGALSTGRRPMAKLSYAAGDEASLSWKGEFAVVKPDTSIIALNFPGEAEEKLPKLEGGVELGYKMGDMFGARAKGVAGGHQYDMVVYADQVGPGDGDRQTVKTQLLAGSLEMDIWKLTLSGNYSWGKNLATYGVWIGDPDGSKLDDNIAIFFPVFGTTDSSSTATKHLANAFTNMYSVTANLHPLDWFAIEVGYGQVLGRHEDLTVKQRQKTTLNALKRVAYYANMQFHLVDRHFLIVPEWSFSDFGGAAGKWYSAGLKLQIDL